MATPSRGRVLLSTMGPTSTARHPWPSRLEPLASLLGLTWTPDDEDRHRHELLVLVGLGIVVASLLIWSPVYAIFGQWAAAAIPFGYAVVTVVSMALLRVRTAYALYRATQFAMFIVLPALLMLVLGGFESGSAVVIWSMLTPLGAVVWGSRREGTFWMLAFAVVVVGTAVAEPRVPWDSSMPGWIVTAFFVLNLTVVPALAFLLLRYYVQRQRVTNSLLTVERAKSERLLLNVLPEQVAGRLREDSGTIADYYPNVSILFADVVGFTVMSSGAGPEKMVGVLNEIFSHFDALAERYGVEKIRTIGDGYMAVCGAPVARSDHAQRMAKMALEMLVYAPPEVDGERCRLRIGLNSGPVIGGVVGTTKFHYDVWGDAVNIAARMESQGVPGCIQVAPGMRELIKDEFAMTERGEQEIKGKGLMRTWFLEGPR